MMSSAVALMHARGRLPENLREEFDRTINAPKQSAQNLVSTLQHINRWVNDNIEVMGAGQGGGHSESAPKDGDTKTNSHGDTVVFRGGKWSLQ
jgi:Zn ribbon nucleic-acid-binding protein